MNDIEKFLYDNTDYTAQVILAIKNILEEEFPDKQESASYALETIKTVIESEQEKMSNKMETVEDYVK